MMTSFSWHSWSKANRRLFQVFVLVFLASLMVMIVAYLRNPAPGFSWQQIQELIIKEIPVHSFEVGGFEFYHSLENYVIYEHWLPNDLDINIQALDVYFAFFQFGIIILLSLVSVLPTFSFYVCCGLWIFIASFFHFEELKIFELENKIPSIAFIIITLAPVLYFKLVGKPASFLIRFMASFLSLLLVLFVVNHFSLIEQPIRHYASNSIIVAMIFFSLCVILVAHEIIASFLFISSRGGGNSSAAKHFFLISLIYLLNLCLAYLSKIGWLDWGYSVPLVILLCISLVVAFWNLRSKEVLYKNYFSEGSYHYFLFIGLGIIAVSTIGYFLATENNPTLIAMNDIILYSHIGYGVIFIIYVISNFLTALDKDIPIFKIVYKPTSMPYFSYRLAGLVVTISLIAYNRWQGTTNRMVSGLHATKADVFESANDDLLALAYYKKSLYHAPYNHHSATKIATLSAQKGDRKSEGRYLQEANLFGPTEYTIINEANWYNHQGQILKKVLVLGDGLKKIPKSNRIKNNLGLAYAKLQLPDSALKYLSESGNRGAVGAVARVNILGMLAENNLQVNTDSIYSIIDDSHIPVKVNTLALANFRNDTLNFSFDFPQDSILNVFSATLIGNYIANHHHQVDTSFLTKCVSYATNSKNDAFKKIIMIPVAKAYFGAGQVNKAFEIYVELLTYGMEEGKLNIELALFLLDLGMPEMALDKIKKAVNHGVVEAPLLMAVALTEAGRIEEAILAWQEMATQQPSNQVAEKMLTILQASPLKFKDLSEKEKYQYIHFRIPFKSVSTLDKFVQQLADENLQAKSYLWQAKKWFEIDELEQVHLAFSKIQNLHLTKLDILHEIRYLELKLLIAEGKWEEFKNQINKLGNLSNLYGRSEGIYFDAFRYLFSGDTVLARQNFAWLGENNPYFDEGIVATANFFQSLDSVSHSYDILSEALQVNPKSVKILKSYILVAQKEGLDRFASSALQTLRGLISTSAFNDFISVYHQSQKI